MKVRIIKTGEIKNHDAGYALRLVEQGKAVPVKEAIRAAARRETERKQEPKAEAKPTSKGKD